MSDVLWIFEMANNHGGSVDHAKLIIDRFAQVRDSKGIRAAIKVQLRDLDTFIHQSYQNSDLKYVKRFNETRLEKEQFREIVTYARDSGFLIAATPFDEVSVDFAIELDVDIYKVASCSVDDWPLLRKLSAVNGLIVVSTAGVSNETLLKTSRVLSDKSVSWMHCVGEYPTPARCSNLDRITVLRDLFVRSQVGISTHESPGEQSIVPYAVAMGCEIVEKHVNVPVGDGSNMNAYSCTPEQIAEIIDDVTFVCAAKTGVSHNEFEALANLKRGVYLARDICEGDIIRHSDLYYAMPNVSDGITVSMSDDIVGRALVGINLKKDCAFPEDAYTRMTQWSMVDRCLRKRIVPLLRRYGVPLADCDTIELSAHYGIEKFDQVGATIVNRINREYCKKLIVMLANQSHPEHHHIKKEEAFELLHGDCTLILNGTAIEMERGKPVVIARGVAHCFESEYGCVIEEVSTTHYDNDSIYSDPKINRLPRADRKIQVKDWKAYFGNT